MNMTEFFHRLENVRPRGADRWMAKCPAHADRYPSLSIRETEDKKILLHCFAGRRVEDVCGAIGIQISDLFHNSGRSRRTAQRWRQRRRVRRFDWRQTAAGFENRAIDLFLSAEAILNAARKLDTSSWTDDDWHVALEAVALAYQRLQHAAHLEELASYVRARGLEKEQGHYAS